MEKRIPRVDTEDGKVILRTKSDSIVMHPVSAEMLANDLLSAALGAQK